MKNRDFSAIFLYEVKLRHNAAETTRNINEAFDECTATKRTGQRWFKKFCSGDMSFENEGPGRPKIVVDDHKLKAQLEADPLRCRKIVDLSSPTSSASYRTMWHGFALVWKNRTSNRPSSQYNFGSAKTLIFEAHISAAKFLEPLSHCAFISSTLVKCFVNIASYLCRVMA